MIVVDLLVMAAIAIVLVALIIWTVLEVFYWAYHALNRFTLAVASVQLQRQEEYMKEHEMGKYKEEELQKHEEEKES